MKAQRMWLEIIALGSAIALALALLLTAIGAAAGVAEDRNETQQSSSVVTPGVHAAANDRMFEGMVTCSRCGAKHSPSLQRPATTCVRVCVHGGASFALVNSDSTYLLEGDAEALKRVAGVRARIVGHLTGKTIKVTSLTVET
ncbi:MAG TPA: hypothetical protein VJQ54_13455 [Candidatus Sulfotelmatobacter sp.]|nr:hypothetical protein [Candidatus Sulfotelmatobacter sp.]